MIGEGVAAVYSLIIQFNQHALMNEIVASVVLILLLTKFRFLPPNRSELYSVFETNSRNHKLLSINYSFSSQPD